MNTRSLKFRLVAWYAGLLTVLFVVFGMFVYTSLRHHLTEGLRAALARRVRQVGDLVQRSPPNWARLGQEIQTHFAPEANNRFTRVTIDQRVEYVSAAPSDNSFDPKEVPAPSAPPGESFSQRTTANGTVLWIFVLSKVVNGRSLVVEEGSAEAPIKAALQGWVAVLIGGLALLVTGAVLGGFFLVKESLQPVDQIIQSAQRISSRNLAERLPVPETRDELERLSVALNLMIERLDESFQHNQRFLADASHELRTPLTMIHAELEEISQRADTNERVRQLAASALEEGERLRRIVEGLFALSRLDAGEAVEQMTAVDITELAGTTAEQLCLLAQDKHISITCGATAPVVVRGDKAHLKQVLVNLLDNAIKYTPPGGRIEVRSSEQDGKGVIEVSDTGIGIPGEALPHIFERFYRVDKARSRDLGGAGLGLSIAKSICAAHGGTIEVHSQEGIGTRFIVRLPLA